ncbi:MAG: FecCD family ABC transporter permease [Coprobacillaceae bacterium]
MNKKVISIASILIVLIAAGSIAAICIGAKTISLDTIWDSIFHFQEGNLDMQLVRDARIPRALATIIVGAGLAIAGAAMQGVTRNPIAEPTIMGVTQGATLIAVIVIVSAMSSTLFGRTLAALVGALGSGLLILVFSMQNARNMSMSRFILMGSALSSFFISIATIIAMIFNRSWDIAFWVAGSFRVVTWSHVILLLFSIICIVILIFLSYRINIVNLGEDIAIGLGENPSRVRMIVILVIIPICAISVSVAGNIAFVGLIVPHIIRRIFGNDYRLIIPFSMLGGAALVVIADIAARMVNSPYETPIGLFTSLIGVPFFLYLVRKENG